MDTYRPGSSNISFPPATPADLQRSDTRSFGETHRNELDRIGSTDPAAHSGIPLTPPATAGLSGTYPSPPGPPPNISVPITQHSPVPIPVGAPKITTNVAPSPPPASSASSPPPGSQSPPLDPTKLNQTPAPIPVSGEKASPVVAPDPSDPSTKVPSVLPTVAETGVPKSAGPDGPGPASGSLLAIKADHDATFPPGYEVPPASVSPSAPLSAEEEKKKLEREERERLLAVGGGSSAAGAPAKFESAEEEKKRLEREERERLLNAGGSASGPGKGPGGPHPDGDGDLPPYQEF